MDPMGYICNYISIHTTSSQKPTCLEVFLVNNLVFRWPKPWFFMVLGAHGIYIYNYIYIPLQNQQKKSWPSRASPWTDKHYPDATGHCAVPCNFDRTPTARVPPGCVVYKVMIAIPGPSWEWWHIPPWEMEHHLQQTPWVENVTFAKW